MTPPHLISHQARREHLPQLARWPVSTSKLDQQHVEWSQQPWGTAAPWLEHRAWIPIPALLLAHHVTLGRSLN